MRLSFRNLSLLMAPALLFAAGCGSGLVTAGSSNAAFSVTPFTSSIDTNCTGCNATSAQGASVHQFTATLAGSTRTNSGPAEVTWSVFGGDATSGPGSISASGQYTPPSYLTADRAEVVVTATLNANPSLRASSVVTLTPGFLQPLAPENVALGANGSVTITGFLAEAGGTTGINFELANSATGQAGSQPGGQSGVQGSLSAVSCQRESKAFTSCSVTYSAPAAVQFTGTTYVVATVGGTLSGPGPASRAASVVLVNTAGVTSNAATHQAELPASMLLGSSGGNNADYDTRGEQIVDCCSGTLGALVEDASKRQFLLSNNHVLARSDHASVGDTIVQPGLIDNNCSPLGDGAGVAPVAQLTNWLPLSSKQTNADAAIAQVTSRAVDPAGRILEMGLKQPDGTLAAAAPGIGSTGGKGEAAWLDLKVVKSGRTTGLTCGGISALDLDVTVDYYLDCAETRPYLTKTFTHQLGVSGNQFSDAGDSGALVVDAANAEPVGLYFAGGTDVSGVSQGVANPASDVLSELGAQAGGGAAYTFVGTADHAVSCLNYGDNTISAAQGRTLKDAETARAQQALVQARMLVNSSTGILGVGTGKSSDHPGEAAVILYTDESRTVNVPATVDGVRTLAIPTTAHAVTYGSAPQNPFEAGVPALPASALAQAAAIKNQVAAGLMRQTPAFFGVGVGQSLDNPREAALVIYVDRNRLPAQLPATVDGLRTRYVVMDRLHVTRSYATPGPSRLHCMAHKPAGQP
jgi:hypothetical protein